MWCPTCRSEYREGITRCPACGVALAADDPNIRSKPQPRLMQPVYLCSFQDRFQLGMARELLDQSGIACFSREPGSGGYLLIVFGTNMFGSDLYVDEADLPRAQELLQALDTPCDEQTLREAYDEYMQAEPVGSAQEEVPRRRNWFAIVMGVCVLILISPLLVNLFYYLWRLFF